MNRCVIKLAAMAAAVMISAAVAPFLAATPAAAAAPVACSALAAWVTNEAGTTLNTNPISPNATNQPINSTTPVISRIIAASGPNLSYCQVVFQIEPFMTIEVGLPLNALDGGTGGVGGGCGNVATGHGGYYTQTGAVNNTCVEGNWNGKIEPLGNGGFSGSVPGVTGATNLGFVGSSTDNGHSNNWCNATNPNTGQPYAQPNCGAAGAGFVLSPANKLMDYQVSNFINGSLVEQTTWAKLLTHKYYGQKETRTYWNGCSTGGRQGMQMAQFHPEMFDGILAGSPAFNWNRFQNGELWAQVVVADIDPVDCSGGTAASCSAGTNATFNNAVTAANAAAVAACDGNDGVLDGVVNEPRLCIYDAKSLIGQTIAPMTAPMTEAEAIAIDLIWDGARNQAGQRLWGGPTRGTSFSIVTGGGLMLGYVQDWMYQNPTFNFLANVTTTNFATSFQLSDRKFADTVPPPSGFVVAAATDIVNLDPMMANNTKLLHYRGLADPLITPFGSWEYDTRLLERYKLTKLQKYYRSFYYPGNGHCGGNGGFANAGLINGTDLFNALIDWVENGVAPASINAYTLRGDTGNTTLICAYPSYTAYNGSGPTTSASSYSCVPMSAENPDLAAYDQVAPRYHEAP